EWERGLPVGEATPVAQLRLLVAPPFAGSAECDPGRSPCIFVSGTPEGGSTVPLQSTVNVSGNHPPVARDDAAVTGNPAHPIEIEVVANDTDADTGQALYPSIVTQPVHGTAEVVLPQFGQARHVRYS